MQVVSPTPGMVITESVRFQPGEYHLPDPDDLGAIRIQASDVVLDLTDVTLRGASPTQTPDTYTGFGIVCQGCDRITIRGGTIHGYRVGVYIQGAVGVQVEDCDLGNNYAMRLGSTPEAEDPDDWLWPHYNDQNEWLRYGAGLYLEECQKAVVRRNRGSRSQNGILLDGVTESQIYDNDFSFLSGWGLALWRSSRNVVSRNRFDWCVRGYSHGVYWRGQDSAGILVFEQSHENVFAYNSATHGGDGFFLYAGHETVERTGEGGCNFNVLYRNDFSHAVANGIEATFSEGNQFVENRVEDCQHGIWGGYSFETRIAGNRIERCAGVGISIEHGHHNRIERNRFRGNPVGIRLWWSPDSPFATGVYGQRRNIRSEENRIVENTFQGEGVAIWLRNTQRTEIRRNRWIDCELEVVREGDCRRTVLAENVKGQPPAAESMAVEPPDLPDLPGEQDPFLPPDARRGRRYIVIGPWGPLRPEEISD